MADRLGIDIGSKTIKLVLVAQGGELVCESYARHRSKVKDALVEAIHDCVWRFGDREVEACVTGSAGMRVAELVPVPFIQEVVALKRAVKRRVPGADAVLEMGGEDTKLVYLSGTPEQRMNTVCAGGTGGFIDLMASLMGVRACEMHRLAMSATTIYPIASRCAVFARSDVRPLLAAGARREDVAASVLEAVCTQAVAGLSAGRPLEGTVVLLGGPFRHIPALRDAFCKVSGIDAAHAIVPEGAHLFVAHGAAASDDHSAPMLLSALEAAIRAADFSQADGIARLPALFTGHDDYEQFRARHAGCRIPTSKPIDAAEGADVFLGIDAGSTTLKMVLVDEAGAMLAWHYEWNEGDVAKSFPRMLGRIYQDMSAPWMPRKTLRRACIVGYGEDFCRAAFGIDDGEVETVAHLRAALELDPRVDFLVDMGGQDIKCFYVRDGQIDDIVLNEACSAGCGSLFDAIARSMRCTKEAFSSEALFAEHPVDLGCRCTTFMESRVKHAQKEGASRADMAAGVVWACARNALFKVVHQPDFSRVGTHVMVQGGAFANDALLRAFELECGVEVVRPDRAELMGAWGAALLARDAWKAARKDGAGEADKGAPREAGEAQAGRQEEERPRSSLIGPEELAALRIVRRTQRCDLCANRCKLMVSRFSVPDEGGYGSAEERVFVTGNRCEKGARMSGAPSAGEASSAPQMPQIPPNMVKLKNALIARCDAQAGDVRVGECSVAGATAVAGERGNMQAGAQGVGLGEGAAAPAAPAVRPSVGVPKALALYESYPFWAAFFTELGMPLVAGDATSEKLYRRHMGTIPVEGACYPSKLLFSHAARLAEAGAELLFVPDMGSAFARTALLGGAVPDALVECPLVERAGTMLSRNMDAAAFSTARLVAPGLTGMRTWDEAAGAVRASLADAGVRVGAAELDRAFAAGQAAYRAFFTELGRHSAQLLARADAGEFPVAVLAGHPYHADPGVVHGIDELLGQMGYAVVEQGVLDAARLLQEQGEADGVGENSAPCALSGAAPSVGATLAVHRDAQLVVLRSFGCGIDAMRADDLREELRRAGHPFAEIKLDQIVDLAAVRIRLRSLAYAARMHREHPQLHAGKKESEAAAADVALSAPASKGAFAGESTSRIFAGDTPYVSADDTPRSSANDDSLSAPAGARLLVPGIFGELGAEVARLMQARGFTVQLLPEIDDADMAAGLALVDNDACNVVVALVGHYARALAVPRAAGDAPDALLAPELCHDCRQVAVPDMLAHALARAGHPPLRLVGFSTAELRGLCPAPTLPRLDPARPAIGVCANAPTLMNSLFTRTVVGRLEKAGCRVVVPPLCDITCEKDFLAPAMDFFEQCGVRDVVCIACFGCLGAHVFARGALRHMQRLHPQIALSVLDYDANASAVNLENRVELVVQSAVERACPR